MAQSLGAARQALLRLVTIAEGSGSPVCQAPLLAAALAARVFRHFGVPFQAKAGYLLCVVPTTATDEASRKLTLPLAIPHVWLETAGGKWTDSCVLKGAPHKRALWLLGSEVKRGDEAACLSTGFTQEVDEEEVVVPPGSVPVSALAEFAGDLEAYVASYLARAPPGAAHVLDKLVEQACALNLSRVEAEGAAAATATGPTPAEED